jgi:uncharacterized membrane protein YfcA
MGGLGFALAGLVVGTAVGATGVGGGSLMTPILILFYGISPAVAVGTDLIYASISKSFGVYLHVRRNTVDWKIVGWLAAGSVPATLLTLVFLHAWGGGASLDKLIKLTLSIAIILTAGFTLAQERLLGYVRQHERLQFLRGLRQRWQIQATIISGALVGTVVTISSVGAGVIGMMLLLLLYPRVAPIKLVGSDLAHAVLITGIAGLGHARLGTVDYSMLGYLLVGALPGIWIGTRIGFALPPAPLKRAIACFLIFIGITTLSKSL